MSNKGMSNKGMGKVVWLIDDDRSISWVLERAFTQAGYSVRTFDQANAIFSALKEHIPNVIFTDIHMPGLSGLELLSQLQDDYAFIPVIVMTAYSDLDSAVSSYQQGAFEYLAKPFDIDDALALLARAIAANEQANETDIEPDSTGAGRSSAIEKPANRIAGLVGQAPAMQNLFQAIGRLSLSDISVLIRGESGTGKELVARALHDSSPRASQPFVEINTAAIPAELLESELFGHEKGAFTGADSLRKGRFEQASGGTLFLDEIGDMPAELQTRLLRVLSEKRFFRVGGRDQLSVNVRVLAATNQNLEARVKDGRFRLDLFHRLNVVTLEIPPLRERIEDIALLAEHFMGLAAQEFNQDLKRIDSSALKMMQAYNWPGNVRELQNQCRRLTVMAPGKTVTRNDLPQEIRELQSEPARVEVWQQALRQHARLRWIKGENGVMKTLQSEIDKNLIEAALAFTDGHKQNAARLLGWGRNTITRKMQELGLH